MARTEYRIATPETDRPKVATLKEVRQAVYGYYPDAANRKAAMALLTERGMSMNTDALQIWSVTVAG